jgi:hypothetical protein
VAGLPWHVEHEHPNLVPESYTVTSPKNPDYNCVAWALDDADSWIDTSGQPGTEWPPHIPREHSVEAYIELFHDAGYLECTDGDLEAGEEKVALYTDGAAFAHVAKQLPDGTWTSKLGGRQDILHDTAERLKGGKYGGYLRFMKRPRP